MLQRIKWGGNKCTWMGSTQHMAGILMSNLFICLFFFCLTVVFYCFDHFRISISELRYNIVTVNFL